MALLDDLNKEVYEIYKDVWTQRDGEKVPEAEDLQLRNDAVMLDAAILYADLADSTGLVNTKTNYFAAEAIKAFLHCSAKIIRELNGTITAYDGDRIMAVWIGKYKNTPAAEAALKIYYATEHIVVPKAKEYYKERLSGDFTLRHGVGIDTGKVRVARTGVRGANDLVWVGKSANIAAKLSGIRHTTYRTFITSSVYGELADSSKLDGNKSPMWETYHWTDQNINIYASSYWWKP